MKNRAVSVPVTPIIGPLKPATSSQHQGMGWDKKVRVEGWD